MITKVDIDPGLSSLTVHFGEHKMTIFVGRLTLTELERIKKSLTQCRNSLAN